MTWKFKKEAWAGPMQGSLGQDCWGWHLPPGVWFMPRSAYAESPRNGIETDKSLFLRPVCGQMGRLLDTEPPCRVLLTWAGE